LRITGGRGELILNRQDAMESIFSVAAVN